MSRVLLMVSWGGERYPCGQWSACQGSREAVPTTKGWSVMSANLSPKSTRVCVRLTGLLLGGGVLVGHLSAAPPQATPVTANRLAVPEPDAAVPPPPPSPHPLEPALEHAARSLAFLTTEVRDYSCRVVKQERIDGRLQPMEFIDAKVRHRREAAGEVMQRAGLYLHFLAPAAVADREVLWVEGRNNGRMTVRRGGTRFQYLTLDLDPRGDAALQHSRYPASESGMLDMVQKLIEVGQADMQYGECEVRSFAGVKLDGRPCECIEVTHPRRRSEFRFHVARIFIDDEYPLPVRYEAYDWPAADEEPPLVEQYTFQNVKLNVGFSDAEFERGYAGYRFRP